MQTSPASLLASPASQHELAVAADAYVVTTNSDDFVARLRLLASTRAEESAHNTVWDAFWNRSWIHVTASPSPRADAALAAAAANVTLLDRLNRLGFASMANSSAGHAIKFNGYGIFSVGNPTRYLQKSRQQECPAAWGCSGTEDTRPWGSDQWFQASSCLCLCLCLSLSLCLALALTLTLCAPASLERASSVLFNAGGRQLRGNEVTFPVPVQAMCMSSLCVSLRGSVCCAFTYCGPEQVLLPCAWTVKAASKPTWQEGRFLSRYTTLVLFAYTSQISAPSPSPPLSLSLSLYIYIYIYICLHTPRAPFLDCLRLSETMTQFGTFAGGYWGWAAQEGSWAVNCTGVVSDSGGGRVAWQKSNRHLPH